MDAIQIGKYLQVGDSCWIEAVKNYQGHSYTPLLSIGDEVSISSWSHISCAMSVRIGDGCLIGSKVYIGDHSHGLPKVESVHGFPGHDVPSPAKEKLSRIDSIELGDGCWICDGAVILAGTKLAAGSVVAANSVVRTVSDRRAIIGGAPAKVIRYLD